MRLFSEWKKEYLIEREMKDINSFKPHEARIIDLWKILYEIEYKYNTIKNKEFSGTPQRKQNILNLLENKAKEIIPILVRTFIQSYDDYFDGFGMETPPAIDVIERPWQFIFETLYNGLMERNDEQGMKDMVEETISKITGKKPSDLFYKMPLKTYLRRTFYKDVEGYEKEFRKEEDFGYVYGAFQVRDMGRKLLSIHDKPIVEQFSIINQAINLTHNVGEMMFHYDRVFNISKSDLTKLSNQSVEEWNKELKELGVNL